MTTLAGGAVAVGPVAEERVEGLKDGAQGLVVAGSALPTNLASRPPHVTGGTAVVQAPRSPRLRLAAPLHSRGRRHDGSLCQVELLAGEHDVHAQVMNSKELVTIAAEKVGDGGTLRVHHHHRPLAQNPQGIVGTHPHRRVLVHAHTQ